MRTTVNLDDDVFELAEQQAKLRKLSLGKTLSLLVRRGLTASTPSRKEGELVVFDLPSDSPTITTDKVRLLESEGT